MDNFWKDVRYAWRVLLKSPGFTVVAVLTLGIGIGANTAIFSVVNAVLLRQLPFRNPHELVWIWTNYSSTPKYPFSLPDFMDYKEQSRSVELAGIVNWAVNLTGNGDPERLQGYRITANAFRMLGVNAAAGRTLLPEDDAPGASRVVVLTYGLWQRRFGGDRGVLEQLLRLNGDSYTVVGVLPRDFVLPGTPAELMVPLAPDSDPWRHVRGSVNFLRVMGRLNPGVSRQQAEFDLSAIAARLRELYPKDDGRKLGIRVLGLRDEILGDYRQSLVLLLSAVGLVLLIACANLASVMLARASTRNKELAVREAMGASRGQLIRQLLTESMMLSLAGGTLGIGGAFWGVRMLLALTPVRPPRAGEIGMDFRVLAFTFSLAVLSGILVGLAPALHAVRRGLSQGLREESRGSSAGARSNRARGLLVISQMALSLVLLVGAGLLMRSFARVQSVSSGFLPENLLVVRMALPKSNYPDSASIYRFHERLQPRIAALPGVRSVGMVSILPMAGPVASVDFKIEGRPVEEDKVPHAQYRVASPDYFRTAGIPLLQGREFNGQDSTHTTSVALINQTLARQFFPNQNPLGEHLQIDDNNDGPRPVEIVGVVGDVKQFSLETETSADVYIALAQVHEDSVPWLRGNQFWVVRTSVEPLALAAAVRAQVRGVDPDVAASNSQSADQYLAASIAPRRFNLLLLEIFAGAALLLAAIGIYGVISYSVTQRRRELGVRIALGAQPGDVLRLMMSQGMQLALIGTTVGLAGALALTRVLSTFLFGVSSTDPATIGAVVILLLVVALAACYLPARRATRVDPIIAMRCD